MNKPELLMPAGNLEKLEYAVRYGADAVYFGVVDFSLRAMRKGSLITMENLKEAVDLAHSLGAKAYVTINIFAFNSDIELLKEALPKFKEANPDAFIVSDFGIFNILKENTNVPIHVSTQTNSLNYECVKFWKALGASRVILARELSIEDIAEIRRKVPDIELENFVHGAQCMSFSGRCLLSDYFTDGERGANHGNCYQPCRWSYELVSKDRDTARCEVVDTPRGSHIMSTKDLCLVKYLPELIKSGTNSLKIEGRTKSLYYVSAVAKVYRQAIDEAYENPDADMEKYYNELLKVGNRGYTTGFALGKHPSDGYSYDISSGLAGADFLFEFLGEEKDGFYKVKIKNKTNLNDEIEIISPSEQFMTKVLEIRDKDFVEIPLGNTNDEIYMKFATSPVEYKYALARTLGIKNPQKDKENVCS
ncbi:MAG: U32 family peptidase [Clostridiaceae bacterium]|jgi:U32 family peptidase|nr:U32 family peptidase [Clostridiaceae bacterium]